MSNIVSSVNFTSGLTLYYFIFNATSQAFNGNSFEDFTTSDWSEYAMPLTETATDIYTAKFPSNIGLGVYYAVAYRQVSSQPLPTDAWQRVLFGIIDWDGKTIANSSNTIIFTLTTGIAELPNITTGIK